MEVVISRTLFQCYRGLRVERFIAELIGVVTWFSSTTSFTESRKLLELNFPMRRLRSGHVAGLNLCDTDLDERGSSVGSAQARIKRARGAGHKLKTCYVHSLHTSSSSGSGPTPAGLPVL